MSDVKISVESVSPVSKKIAVEVPAHMIDKAFNTAVQKIGKRAKINGFRPGKVPREVVERMYAPQVADEVALSVINETYFEALKANKLRAVDMPKVDNGTAVRGADFKYTATVEVIPPVELKKYKGLAATVDKLAVTDDSVERALDRLRESKAELVEVAEARPIKEGDFAIIDLEGKTDGKVVPGMSAKGFTVPVGGKVIFDEIETGLVGMKVGETKHATVNVPAEAENKELAGKALEFDFVVQALKEKSLPAADDEFAKDLGEYDSIAGLRERIRNDLNAEVQNRIEKLKRERAVDALIGANPVEVPPGLAAREADNLVHQTVHNYQNRGLDTAGVDTARLFSQALPAAERRIRSELLLDAIADQEKLAVSDADVNKFFEEEAARQGATADAVKRAYLQNGADMKDRLRIDKALEWVVAEAKWTEVEPTAAAQAAE